ncbi:hypothetical protein HZC34_02280 [Candidatus Saganbacteria bacterium]|nr:hypothetical protein [Candidatus Saganbacteria bacterium]
MVENIGMFDDAYLGLETAMKKSAEIQAVHAHNLANINTPGFEPLEFNSELGRAQKRLDGKKVNLEEEMSKLSENSTKYSAYVKLLTQKINIIKSIASQGRK